MYHMHSSTSHDFLAHGTQAIDVTHTMDRRLAAAETHRVIANIHESGPAAGFRHTIGTMLISFGAFISGTSATIQDRHATMPVPTPKSGFVPTR